jgi:MFS family permease
MLLWFFVLLQVGLGEGFAPSAATSVLAWQVPSTERSRAVTTVWGGLDVGSAVGLLLSGPLIRMYGWPSVFYLFAVLGGIWCLLWPLVRPGMQVRPALGCRGVMAVAQQQKRQLGGMYGWPSVFYLFAVLGGIWCLLWPLVRPGMQVRAALGCRGVMAVAQQQKQQ